MKVNLSVTPSLILFVIVLLIIQTIFSISFGQQNNINNESLANSATLQTTRSQIDTVRPAVKITYPDYPPTVTTGKIVIQGTASDSGSGIRNVTAAAHTFPFNDSFSLPLASQSMPISPNNWSHWSVPLIINDTGTYRVVIAAIDNAGNVNYAETTINAALPEYNSSLTTNEMKPKIAFVRPTFTEAAYQEHGFYRFYFKYGFPPFGKNITTDLDMLTVKLPKSVPELVNRNGLRNMTNITALVPINGSELRDVSYDDFPHPQKFWLPFIDNVKKVAPNATVTVMRDEDVNDGHIFYPDNKTNAYAILVLFHDEYVTQQEYDNLKQFVKNGGTVIFIDGNVVYTEIRYDRDNHAITLVKGHSWEFNGKAARRSVTERWYNDTKDWVGGNYLLKTIESNVTYSNNPFNYSHFEEQFVNNPKAKIIVDYGVKFKRGDYVRQPLLKQTRVATYSLDYGKGKVIMLGLSGRLLAENKEFMKFFDNTILPIALCPKFQPCVSNSTTNYLYGCTKYENIGFHCDTIPNEFKSYQVLANFTKVASATRVPDYVDAKYGKGIHTTGPHELESLRANIIDAYNVPQFSVYISINPDGYDKTIGNRDAKLITYRNGIFNDDNNTSGWEVEFVSNNSEVMKKLHFTVYNTHGDAISSKDVDVPTGKFSEIVGTFDGKTVRVILNGVLKSETPFTGNYSGLVDRDNFLKVAGDAYCTCYLASGIIDEVRYYNYSLKNQQARQIHNQSDDILGKGLIGYWKFDGDLKDYSRFKNDMFYNTPIASMAYAPDGRLFYTEKNSGNVRIMQNNTVLDRPFASIPKIHVDFEQGLLGIAIDSKFKENHFVYVFYNYDDYSSPETNVWGKIVRFTDVDNEGTNETLILDKIPGSVYGYHTGGALMFNKIDDKLYATVGDAIDDLKAQNISSLYGKTLRINRDGSIPNDNPFPESPVYTYGHRNMYGIAFDQNGHGIVSEPASSLYDEINSNIRGGNYGWPTMQPENIPTNPLSKDKSIKPLRSYYVTTTPTQIVYYNGNGYPELNGKFIVGSFRGDLYAYKISDNGTKLLEEIKMYTSVYPSKEVVATAVSPNGQIYFGAYDIFKLEKLDLTSREEMMYPIQINATNLRISNVDYTARPNMFTLDLIDRHGSSALFIKIPRPFFDLTPGEYYCQSKNNSATSKVIGNGIRVPYQVELQKHKNLNAVVVQFQQNAPENLQLTIGTNTNSCIINQNMGTEEITK